jgi:hypothetical protein
MAGNRRKGRGKGGSRELEQPLRGGNPELEAQLSRAERAGTPVQAVFVLRGPTPDRPLAPDEAEALAQEVVARAERETGQKSADLNVFRNLSSFVVEGPPELLRRVASDESVESAMPNRAPGSMRIDPPRRPR